jgi:uncharacterized membrane protein
MVIALFVYLLAVVVWLGGMLFFTIITAPAVFEVLATVDAGKVVAAIFPRYYLIGYGAGTIGVILAIYFAVQHGPTLWWSLAGLALAIALALTLYAGAAVRPQINAIRAVATEANPDPARKAEFDRLHRLSVALNGGVMVLNLLALLSTATAVAPRG